MSTRFFLLLLNLPLLLIRAEVIRFHASTDGEGFVFLGRSRLLGFKKSIWTFRSRDGWFQQKRYQSKAEEAKKSRSLYIYNGPIRIITVQKKLE